MSGAPMLLLLSTDGLLCPYMMLNNLPIAAGLSLTVKSVFLTVNGMRDPMVVRQKPVQQTMPVQASKPVIVEPPAPEPVRQALLPALIQKPVTVQTPAPEPVQQPTSAQAEKPVQVAAMTHKQPLLGTAASQKQIQTPYSEPEKAVRQTVIAKPLDSSGGVEKNLPPETLAIRKFVAGETAKFEKRLASVKQRLRQAPQLVGTREEMIEVCMFSSLDDTGYV